MKKLYYTSLLIIFGGSSCLQKETLTREEVLSAIQHFDNAWKNKNAKTVDSVLSPSYIYFTQSGGFFDRKNVVQTAASPDYKLQTLQREQLDIKIEGNTAVVNTIWKAAGTYFGTPFNDRQRCSITIIKNKGKVEILSEHCTLIKKE
jgi:ketosteroid isomerase-like protein